MEVTSVREGGALICKLVGRLDASSSPMVDQAMQGQLTEDDKLLLCDMAELEYISSAGLRILLMRAKEMAARKGKLALFAPRPEVKQVFEIAGFTKIIPLFATKDEALKAC